MSPQAAEKWIKYAAGDQPPTAWQVRSLRVPRCPAHGGSCSCGYTCREQFHHAVILLQSEQAFHLCFAPPQSKVSQLVPLRQAFCVLQSAQGFGGTALVTIAGGYSFDWALHRLNATQHARHSSWGILGGITNPLAVRNHGFLMSLGSLYASTDNLKYIAKVGAPIGRLLD